MGRFSMGRCCCCTFIKVPLISCRKVRSCEAQSRSFLEQCLQAQSMASFKRGDDKKFGKDAGLHQSMRTSKTDKTRKSDEGGLDDSGKGKKKKGGVGADGTDEDKARQSGKSGKSKKGKTKAGDESDSEEDGKGGKKKRKSGTKKGARGTDDDDDEDDETGGKKGKKSKQDSKKKKKDKTSDFEEGKIKKSKAAGTLSKLDKKTGKKGKKKTSGESGDSDAISGRKLKGKKQKIDAGKRQKIDAAKKSKKSKRKGLRGDESISSTAGESGRLNFGKFELTKEEKERRKAKDRAVKCHMIIEANRIKRVQLLKVTGSKSLSDMIERKMKEKEKQLKDKPYNDVGRMFDSTCSSVTSLTKPNINVFFEHGCADPVKALKLFSFDEQMISNERSFNIGERTGNGCPRNTCYLCNR